MTIAVVILFFAGFFLGWAVKDWRRKRTTPSAIWVGVFAAHVAWGLWFLSWVT